MAQETAGRKWSYADFNEFGRWWSTRRKRETGAAASRHTLRTRQVHIARIAKDAGALDEVSLANLLVSRTALNRVLDEMACRMTPGAMRQAVYALRAYGDYAVAKGWIPEHVVMASDVPTRNPTKAITTYTPEEMEQFIALAKGRGVRWWAFLAFLAETGRRVGETLELRWEWFRLDANPPYIELPFSKSGKPQYIPLTPFLRDKVFTPKNIEKMRSERREGHRAWRRSTDEYPFPWQYTTVANRFDHFCKITGLPNRGFHNFRHTVITERIGRGWPMQAVSKLAGHANTAVTEARYDHTSALSFTHLLDAEDRERRGRA